ncbi:MAG: riboflavin synthase [Candidatus Eremiobacteraeota bacterium]|nr:riboflavin synthase [Candidatus Eremiobacteraeota bacterium]
MFTGIIAHLGRVREIEHDARGGIALQLFAPTALEERPVPKDSISVNGVCLTLTSLQGDTLRFDVVPETLRRTNLGSLRQGDVVNLELSLRLGDRLSGHLVYGHIDATVTVQRRIPEGQGFRVSVQRPPDLATFIVEKGCVALDGVSLTVASVDAESFDVAVVPETAARTTFGVKGAGALLNLEIDPIARYALGACQPYEPSDTVRSDELAWAYEI